MLTIAHRPLFGDGGGERGRGRRGGRGGKNNIYLDEFSPIVHLTKLNGIHKAEEPVLEIAEPQT